MSYLSQVKQDMEYLVGTCCQACMNYQFVEEEFLDAMDFLADYFGVDHGFVAAQIQGTVEFPMFDGDAAELEYRLRNGGVYTVKGNAGLPPVEFANWNVLEDREPGLRFWNTVLFDERLDRGIRRTKWQAKRLTRKAVRLFE